MCTHVCAHTCTHAQMYTTHTHTPTQKYSTHIKRIPQSHTPTHSLTQTYTTHTHIDIHHTYKHTPHIYSYTNIDTHMLAHTHANVHPPHNQIKVKKS